MKYPFVDLALARRLERAEAHVNSRFVESRLRQAPESRAGWIDVAGAYAMFDGVGSPLTQTFGLGLFQPPTAGDFTLLEDFFSRHGAAVFHEVSPLADATTFQLLAERRYAPFEFTSVMYRPLPAGIAEAEECASRVHVRRAKPEDADLWATIAADGWSEFPELSAFMRQMGLVTVRAEDSYAFFAEVSGRPIATGLLALHDGVALLAGGSTVPTGRRQGAQSALLSVRLTFAAGQGCDLAMMCAQPGSASQRNAERNGFRIAYTRFKFQKAAS